jgi:hypothetical protein
LVNTRVCVFVLIFYILALKAEKKEGQAAITGQSRLPIL